ncbi:hypothetical protein AAG570_004252, partial [Ranatra chinensis]
SCRCKELAHLITKLRDFLLEHRTAYLDFSPGLLAHSDRMSDRDRDRIDKEADEITKACTQILGRYKLETAGQSDPNRKAVLEVLETYLKNVSKIFTEMKLARVKWTVDLEAITKLEPVSDKTFDSDRPLSKRDLSPVEKRPRTVFTDRSLSSLDDDNKLTEAEMQMFEAENEMLFNQVKEIQSKVVKLAELQEMFTEKVLEQSEDIERIERTVVGTTENVIEANTQLRQAIQNYAGLRAFVLFFLLVMSGTLAFLNWYND